MDSHKEHFPSLPILNNVDANTSVQTFTLLSDFGFPEFMPRGGIGQLGGRYISGLFIRSHAFYGPSPIVMQRFMISPQLHCLSFCIIISRIIVK